LNSNSVIQNYKVLTVVYNMQIVFYGTLFGLVLVS